MIKSLTDIIIKSNTKFQNYSSSIEIDNFERIKHFKLDNNRNKAIEELIKVMDKLGMTPNVSIKNVN